MKVTKLEIKDFKQIKNLSLDLTYPKGHEKEGKPLDKVCLIGQNGTGKTTVLKLLKQITLPINVIKSTDKLPDRVNYLVNATINHEQLKYCLKLGHEKDVEFGKLQKVPSNFQINSEDVSIGDVIEYLEKEYPKKELVPSVLFYPECFKELSIKQRTSLGENQKEIDLSILNVNSIWNTLQEEIEAFRIELLEMSNELREAKETDIKSRSNSADEVFEEIQQWRQVNPDPLNELADKVLDPILENFNLCINTSINRKVIKDLKYLPVRHKISEQEFDFHELSSGTQSIILSSLPLYKLANDKTVVLMDEVENSLYPDIQRMIIDYYTSLSPDSQFFFATHSPIIASNFEPWEIIELKFDEEGKVYQDSYLKDESKGREVDNYSFYPKYLRWDAILTDIFDLEADGPKERQQQLDHLAYLKEKLKSLRSKQAKGNEIESLLEDINETASKLSWDLD